MEFTDCLHAVDVEEIIRCHRKKAEEKDGFLQDLCNTFYGFNTNSELAWSLQDVVSGVRVRSPLQSDGDHLRTGQSPIVAEIERRRCQVRAYVVMVNGALYLYTTYEVRLPCWNIDLDATLAAEHAMYNTNKRVVASSGDVHQVGVREAGESTFSANWSDELENEYCGLGHGRPYNEHRNKGQTERYLLSELPELQGCESAVTDCMVELFTKMKPVLLHRQRTSASQSGTKPSKDGLGHIFDAEAIIKALESAHLRGTEEEAVPADGQQCTRADVVIVGVDLVLNCTTNTVAGEEPARSFSAKIVEINNNPAMPAEGKNMSALYREHLVSFVGSTIALAVAATAPQVPADPAVTSRFYKI